MATLFPFRILPRLRVSNPKHLVGGCRLARLEAAAQMAGGAENGTKTDLFKLFFRAELPTLLADASRPMQDANCRASLWIDHVSHVYIS
jgi:hypothetical protein